MRLVSGFLVTLSILALPRGTRRSPPARVVASEPAFAEMLAIPRYAELQQP
jgi:hypothetical protein